MNETLFYRDYIFDNTSLAKSLCLFMPRVLPASLTELLELQPRFDRLFILRGIIIDLFALGAFQFNKIVLGHTLNEL